MTRDELMLLPPEEAIHELVWDSIEFLFRPTNVLELLLRLHFDSTVAQIEIGEMPEESRVTLARAADAERYYRELVELKDT